ncbi:hypothetical protein C8F01DRAFT_585 [Mycena amicta]|nr:hypothetical protein C8F01DRAFT_585 [Mycena amicta]
MCMHAGAGIASACGGMECVCERERERRQRGSQTQNPIAHPPLRSKDPKAHAKTERGPLLLDRHRCVAVGIYVCWRRWSFGARSPPRQTRVCPHPPSRKSRRGGGSRASWVRSSRRRMCRREEGRVWAQRARRRSDGVCGSCYAVVVCWTKTRGRSAQTRTSSAGPSRSRTGTGVQGASQRAPGSTGCPSASGCVVPARPARRPRRRRGRGRAQARASGAVCGAAGSADGSACGGGARLSVREPGRSTCWRRESRSRTRRRHWAMRSVSW